jgi:hypothetical protein
MLSETACDMNEKAVHSQSVKGIYSGMLSKEPELRNIK